MDELKCRMFDIKYEEDTFELLKYTVYDSKDYGYVLKYEEYDSQ